MDDKTKQSKRSCNLPAIVAAQSAMAPTVGEQIALAVRARPGQPTKRTPEMIETILDRIADGRSLLSVCQDDDMPGYSTFNRWCREDRALLEAVDIAYEFHARTMDDMADSILAGEVGSTGEFRRDEARVAHIRWRLGKINRRRFGEKVQVDVVDHKVFVMPTDVIDGEGF